MGTPATYLPHTGDISASGARMRMLAFDGVHPAVPTLFFAGAVVLAAVGFHPVLAGVSLVLGLAVGAVARGWAALGKTLCWLVPLMLFVAVLTPLLSGQGATLVAKPFGRPLYAEGALFGFTMAAMMAAMVVWAQNAACSLTAEDAMALGANAAPTTTLVLSMVCRFVPAYVAQGASVAAADAANAALMGAAGGKRGGGLRAAVGHRARRATALFGSSMEGSLATADSMTARGWNCGAARTTYRRIRFTRFSAGMLAAVVLLLVAAAVATWAVAHPFEFYPTATSIAAMRPAYAAFALYFALPLALECKERLAWRA